jgi:signal transduction histidine kinase
MGSLEQDRYEILRALVTAGTANEKLEETGRLALEQTVRLVGLSAAALYLWDEQKEISLHLAHAETDEQADRLAELETDLFAGMRRERNLVSAYMSFGGDPPSHSFTLPLRLGETVFGAVVGLQQGERTTISEGDFLDALSATLALHAVASGLTGAIPQELIDKVRLNAVLETAVTVNDKINNALQAIIGPVQLLLMHRDDLDDDLRGQLNIIEESASRIKEVIQGLLRLTSAKSTEYVSGTSMIDLPGPDDDKPEK